MNLVDPSGYLPCGSDPIDCIKNDVRATFQPVINAANDFRQWWNKKPQGCECQAGGAGTDNALGSLFNNTGFNAALNVAPAKYTDPFVHTGTMTIVQSQRTRMDAAGPIQRFLRWAGGPRSGGLKVRSTDKIIFEGSGEISGWTRWRMNGNQPSLTNALERTHLSNVDLHINGSVARGFLGATLASGLIDGVLQGLSDALLYPCFSWGQRGDRLAVALGFGLLAGLAGVGAFYLLAAAGAPPLITAAVSWGAGVGTGVILNRWKQPILDRIRDR